MAERLWLFGALQAGEWQDPSLFGVTGEPLSRSSDDRRTMLKIDAAVGRGHLLRGLFLHGDADLEAPSLPISVARSTQDVSNLARDLWSLGYRGVLASQLFADVRYSQFETDSTLGDTPAGAGSLRDAPFLRKITPLIPHVLMKSSRQKQKTESSSPSISICKQAKPPYLR